jgi:hypothetical protein
MISGGICTRISLNCELTEENWAKMTWTSVPGRYGSDHMCPRHIGPDLDKNDASKCDLSKYDAGKYATDTCNPGTNDAGTCGAGKCEPAKCGLSYI